MFQQLAIKEIYEKKSTAQAHLGVTYAIEAT
jgi:hypothetical protein